MRILALVMTRLILWLAMFTVSFFLAAYVVSMGLHSLLNHYPK